MAVRVKCPCGHKFTVEPSEAERKFPCPECGAKLALQAASSSDSKDKAAVGLGSGAPFRTAASGIRIANQLLATPAESWTTPQRDQVVQKALAAAADDPDMQVAQAALESLAHAGPKEARKAMAKLSLISKFRRRKYAGLDLSAPKERAEQADKKPVVLPNKEPWRFPSNDAYDVADFESDSPDIDDLAWLIDALLDPAQGERFGYSPVKMIEAMGKIGHPDAIPVLTRLAKDDAVSVRGPAVRALGQIGNYRAFPVLSEIEQARDESIRVSIHYASEQMRNIASTVGTQLQILGDAERMTNLKHSHAELLNKLGGKGAKVAVPSILPYAHDKDPEVRLAAIRALGKIRDATAVPNLCAVLKRKDADESVLAATLWALGQIGDPRAMRDMLRAAPNPSESVRAAAVKGLGIMRNDAVASTFAKWAIEDTVQFKSEADAHLLEKAVGKAGDIVAVQALQSFLDSADPSSREKATRVLRHVIGRYAVRAAILALEDADVGVRFAAVEALAGQLSWERHEMPPPKQD